MTTEYQDRTGGKKPVGHRCLPLETRSVEYSGSGEGNPRRTASLRAFERDLDSSESIPSEHSSMYDAARASSGSEPDKQTCYDGVPKDDMVGNEQNTTIPDQPVLESTSSHSKWPVNTLTTIVEQRSTLALRHSRSLSYLYGSFCGNGPQPTEPTQSNPTTSNPATRRRKAASLDDADNSTGGLNWLASNLSPVSPAQPTHPPPVRSPTPPGLPSFGTEEALFCASRFAIHSPPQGSQAAGAEDSRRNSYDSIIVGSYGEALRRLFGFSSPMEPRPSRLPINAIGRAEDGTAVRGRFPYRQSGHGMDLSKPLDGHPFHRRTLPVAQPSNIDGYRSAAKGGKPGRQSSNGEVEPSHAAGTTHSQDRSSPMFHSSLLNPLSSPKPAVTAGVRRTDPRTPASPLPSISSHQHHDSRPSQVHRTPSANNAGRTLEIAGSRSTDIDGNISAPYQSSPQPSSSAVQPENSAPEMNANEEKKVNSWSGLWKKYTSAFCCCSADEDEQASILQLSNSQSSFTTARSRSANVSEDVSSPVPVNTPQTRANTSESSDGQRRSRTPRPWRPAYGFYPQEIAIAISSVV